MRNLFAIGTVVCLLVSCNQENSNSEISKKIEQICKDNNTCKISMRDIVTEPWEKMYVFKEGASLEEINQVLGFKYKYFEDIGKRIVFVKNNEVVYHEDEFPGVESAKNGELIFNIGDTNLYKSYNRNDAIFLVEKIDFSHGAYYQLTQSK